MLSAPDPDSIGLVAVVNEHSLPSCVFVRQCRDLIAQRLDDDGPHLPTYFDSLPYDVLENLVRQSSPRPRRNVWGQFFSPEDIQKLLSERHPLYGPAHKILTKFVIGDCIYNLRCHDTILSIDTELGRKVRTLDAMAPTVKTVALFGKETNANFFLTIAYKCKVLSNLRISRTLPGPIDTLRYMFEERGHQLDTIYLSRVSSEMVDLVASTCRKLQRVRFKRPPSSLDDFWESVGSSLLQVQIRGMTPKLEVPCIVAIQLHCRKLRNVRIELSRRSDAYPLYSALLALCGKRLQSGWVGEMPAELCRAVAHACPHANFDLRGMEISWQIGILGPSLRWVHCEAALNVEQMRADLCENLRTLYLLPKACALTAIRAIFSKPKLQLIRLGIGRTTGHCDEILDIVAKGTGALKEFYCVVDIDESFSFRSVAKANPNLETVRVRLTKGMRIVTDPFPFEACENIVLNIVMSFKLCVSVQELIVWVAVGNMGSNSRVQGWGTCYYNEREGPKLEAVANACCVFRSQRTYVRVFGVDYLS